MALIDINCLYQFRVAIIPKRVTPLRSITLRLRFGCIAVTHKPMQVSGISQYLVLYATGMVADICDFVLECPVCQIEKGNPGSSEGNYRT